MRMRKAYRPKPVNRPVLKDMHRDLMLPAFAALEVLRTTGDQEARHDALVTVKVLIAAARDAAEDKWGDDAFTDDVDRGIAALYAAKERHQRSGQWGVTGAEYLALRSATLWCDGALPLLGTARLSAAYLRLLAESEAMA